jgi:hypothetical protein
MNLNAEQQKILSAMRDGATLKAHRTLDGEKTHLLHPLAGPPVPVSSAAMDALKRRGLIASNMKFPAAAYLLTERGLGALGCD